MKDLHTKLRGLFVARTNLLRPTMPTAWENKSFIKPDPQTGIVLPQVSRAAFSARVPDAGDVYGIEVEGVFYSVVAGAAESLADVLGRLASAITFPSVLRPSGIEIDVTGTTDGIPFTMLPRATSGAADISGAVPADPVTEVQAAFIGNCWYESYLLPGEPWSATIGVNGQDRHVGIYQLNVNVPDKDGWGRGTEIADLVCEHFKKGTLLEEGRLRVEILRAYQSAGTPKEGWYRIPVSISYRFTV